MVESTKTTPTITAAVLPASAVASTFRIDGHYGGIFYTDYPPDYSDIPEAIASARDVLPFGTRFGVYLIAPQYDLLGVRTRDGMVFWVYPYSSGCSAMLIA